MTDQEMRIEIAEACGEHCYVPHDESYPQPVCRCGKSPNEHAGCPDYLNSLNAMHEAEATLTPPQWRFYSDKLMRLICDSDLALGGSNIEARYRTAHATARQRAEAFLRTIGKWKETP